ncbi:MAG: hypothetical protein HFE62_03665 [Firmicutes bacterium]|nr:hypothetical protein [Bacillota bacterium]
MILNVYKKFFNVLFCQSVFSRRCLAIVKISEPRESRGGEAVLRKQNSRARWSEPRESRGAQRSGAFPEGKFESLLCEPAESAGAKCNEAFREAEFENLLE